MHSFRRCIEAICADCGVDPVWVREKDDRTDMTGIYKLMTELLKDGPGLVISEYNDCWNRCSAEFEVFLSELWDRRNAAYGSEEQTEEILQELLSDPMMWSGCDEDDRLEYAESVRNRLNDCRKRRAEFKKGEEDKRKRRRKAKRSKRKSKIKKHVKKRKEKSLFDELSFQNLITYDPMIFARV